MIINRVTGDCPECGAKNNYGVCLVSGDRVLKGCGKCNFSLIVPLPPVTKKVLYLDQCFHSKLFRNSNCDIKMIGQKIEFLAHSQQLVTPFASVHETESLQWSSSQRNELFKFIKRTARGHHYKLEYEIRLTQIHRALTNYLTGSEETIELKANDALDSRINDWDSHFWIDMDISFEDPEATAKEKSRYIEELISLFPTWRTENFTFSENLQAEFAALATRLWYSLQERLTMFPAELIGGTTEGALRRHKRTNS